MCFLYIITTTIIIINIVLIVFLLQKPTLTGMRQNLGGADNIIIFKILIVSLFKCLSCDILVFIISCTIVRNIVVKAIDLWCKPDTPEDNFEEDASGWGSGDEVNVIFLYHLFFIQHHQATVIIKMFIIIISNQYHRLEEAVEGTLERPTSRPSGGPHPEWLCEMCKVGILI